MIELMWMMRPHLRSFICGTSARLSAIHALKLSSRTLSQSSSLTSSIDCGTFVPALLMRMSTLPILSSAAFASFSGFLAAAQVRDRVSTAHGSSLRDLLQRRLQFLFLPAADEHIRAGLCESAGHGLPEPLAAAGNEGDFP